MCLIAVEWDADTGALLLAANRDEFHERPTAAADWWPATETGPGIFGGRDLRAGGSWLAVDIRGRLAAVTNVRGPAETAAAPASRGQLVADFLRGEAPASAFAGSLADSAMRYGGFNLLLCDGRELVYASNRPDWRFRVLGTGLHVVSNAALDTPWPKAQRLRTALAAARQDDAPEAALFAALADDRPAPSEALPDTGVGREMERFLSPPFIRGRHYGTRCSTLIRIAAAGHVRFQERRFDPEGAITGTTEEQWQTPVPA